MLMAQRAARVEVLPPPTTDRPFAGTPEELGPDWLILRDCRLGATARGGLASVLLHPARGVAVLDILPSRTPDAAEAVRALGQRGHRRDQRAIADHQRDP